MSPVDSALRGHISRFRSSLMTRQMAFHDTGNQIDCCPRITPRARHRATPFFFRVCTRAVFPEVRRTVMGAKRRTRAVRRPTLVPADGVDWRDALSQCGQSWYEFDACVPAPRRHADRFFSPWCHRCESSRSRERRGKFTKCLGLERWALVRVGNFRPWRPAPMLQWRL